MANVATDKPVAKNRHKHPQRKKRSSKRWYNGGKKPWWLMSPEERSAEVERCKRYRRQRYRSDPKYLAATQAQMARWIERQGFKVAFGPSGWPYAINKRRGPS
jgi:hypothetical protein